MEDSGHERTGGKRKKNNNLPKAPEARKSMISFKLQKEACVTGI